jgi:hypothetical protein
MGITHIQAEKWMRQHKRLARQMLDEIDPPQERNEQADTLVGRKESERERLAKKYPALGRVGVS